MLLALPAQRWRALAVAGASAAALYAPLVVAQLDTPAGVAAAAVSNSGGIFQPWQLWWFLGAAGHIVRDANGQVLAGYRVPPGWVATVAHPLIVLVSLPLTLLFARRARLETDALGLSRCCF